MALAAINLSAVAAGTGGFVLIGQSKGDYSGRSVAAAGDVNGDGFDDLIIGADTHDPGAITDAGRAYVVFGKATAFPSTVTLASIAAGTGGFVLNGEAKGDGAGFAVSSAGDINGDGFADMLVAAPNADPATGTDAGRVYVVFGSASAFAAGISLSSIAAGTGGFVLNGASAYDLTTNAVAAAGDVNGDGFDDLIVGVNRAGGNAGESFVVFGKSAPFAASVNLSTIGAGTGGFSITGSKANDFSGYSVSAAGDVNGDGIADLIVGAPFADPAAGKDAGTSYVVFGTTSGFGANVSLTNIAAGTGGFAITGQAGSDYSGFSVAGAGDFNGDGIADLIVGAYRGDPAAGVDAGQSYVVFGTTGGFAAGIKLADVAAGTGGFILRGQAPDQRTGFVVASAGDVNGDGRDDLVVSAPFADPTAGARAGQIYVVLGTAAALTSGIDLATIAAGTGGFVINGQTAAAYAGDTVASAGDINGDGFDDLVIGARRADPSTGTNAGRTYVIHGRDFTGSLTKAGTDKAETLTGTAGADDIVGGQGADEVIGNGGADVLIGGSGDDQLHVSDLTFLRLDGGSGQDTMVLDGAGITLDLTTIADGKLQGVEAIDLTGSGNNALILSAREVLNLSGASRTVTINGNAGDSLSFGAEKWTTGATAAGFTTYSNGNATAKVNTDISVACFAAGSRIMTAAGEIPVEALAAGDRLVVRGTAGTRPVRWLGYRTVQLDRHPRPWDVQPVRVCADAFGPGLPHRDLRLSPDHAVFVDDVLVPVRHLINGATIIQEQVETVTYYHIELADAAGAAVHDVLSAEGLPVESFLDTGNRAAFANGGATVMAQPDFARRTWQAAGCAPLVVGGPKLEALQVRLLVQASALGHDVTADPDLHLVVDGKVVRPDWIDSVHGFVLPDGARHVRLVSRVAVPAWRGLDDTRRLGVAVGTLVLDGVPLALDEHDAGWHATEAGWRWTQGDAVLPCAGGCVLEVGIVELIRYWQHPAMPARRAAA